MRDKLVDDTARERIAAGDPEIPLDRPRHVIGATPAPPRDATGADRVEVARGPRAREAPRASREGVGTAAWRLCAVTLLFFGLAALKTYPLILRLGTSVSNPGDPLFNTWVLAWDVHALATDPLHLFDANIFYPVQQSLAFSDHLLGVLPIFAVPYLITGNPVLGYNVLLLLSFTLSGVGMFSLAYHWTRATWPSLVAGALFGFALFRFAQLDHLQLLNFFWAPWALLFLDRFLMSRRWRDLAVFAVFYWLQILSSLYLAYMVSFAAVLYATYHAVVLRRRLYADGMVLKIAAFIGASALVLLPTHLPYLAVNRAWGAYRSISEILWYSPDLLSYLTPPFVGGPYSLLPPVVAPVAAHEKWLFPGLILPALAVAGGCAAVSGLPGEVARRLRQVFLLITGAAVLVSLGPYLIVLGHETWIPLPYLLLYRIVPGFAGMRVPGRFALLAVFAASPVAALGTMKLCETVRRWSSAKVWARVGPALVSLALIALVCLESGWRPLPLIGVPTGSQVGAAYRWLAAEHPGPVVELPFPEPGDPADYRYVYLSTAHWQPLVNGVSGFFPPTYAEIREAFARLPARKAVVYAAALGIKVLVVHTGRLSAEELDRWSPANTSAAGLRKVAEFGSEAIYAVPSVGAASTLTGETAVNEWLPARTRVRLGVFLRGDRGRPWVHPKPQGRSTAVVRITDPSTGRSVVETTRWRLPLVIDAEPVMVAVEARVPDDPGRYVLQVTSPSTGVASVPQAVEVRRAPLVTSRDGAPFLSAAYDPRYNRQPFVVSSLHSFDLDLTAINTGSALWLSQAEGDNGRVDLGWRWLKEGRELGGLTGRTPIGYDVLPGQRYQFHLAVPPPEQPGTYTLELGLVSERVAWFSDAGTPPARLLVAVEGPTRSPLMTWLGQPRAQLPHAPRLATAAERIGDVSRLDVVATVPEGSWVVDAYLILEDPEGRLWLTDGQRLARPGDGLSLALVRGIVLSKGTLRTVLRMPIPSKAELRGGEWTWYLVLTEVDTDRIIAEATAPLRVRR